MDPKLLELILSKAFKPVGDGALMALGQLGRAGLVFPDDEKARAEEIKARLDSGGAFQPGSREDLEPKPEDLIYPVFRLLSQAVIECYGVDFRRPGVLDAAVPLAQGLTIYPDHQAEVERWIGKVESTWWDNPAESGTPFDVPGINGRLSVDWKANPKIARGILSGILDSVSITPTFTWQKSHPDLRDWQFWEMLGREVDGRIVLIEVLKILKFDELSIVWSGADSRAKKVAASVPLINGNEIQINASTVFSSPAGDTIESLPGGEEMDPKLQALLEALKVDTPEAALERVAELAARPAPDPAIQELAAQLEKAGVKPGEAFKLVEAGKAHRAQLEQDLERYARLALCDAEDGQLPDGFAESHANLSIQQLTSQVKFHQELAQKKYPLRCQECGSKNVSSKVSAKAELGDEKGGQRQGQKLDLKRIHG